LQKAFETATQLLQQYIDEKQHVSQDNPDNSIGVQNIQAGEIMQDFKYFKILVRNFTKISIYLK